MQILFSTMLQVFQCIKSSVLRVMFDCSPPRTTTTTTTILSSTSLTLFLESVPSSPLPTELSHWSFLPSLTYYKRHLTRFFFKSVCPPFSCPSSSHSSLCPLTQKPSPWLSHVIPKYGPVGPHVTSRIPEDLPYLLTELTTSCYGTSLAHLCLCLYSSWIYSFSLTPTENLLVIQISIPVSLSP